MNISQITKILAVEMTARTNQIWRAKIKAYRAELYTVGAWLDLYIDKERIVVQASRPAQMAWGASGDKITADLCRNPEAIAGDIERRLLQNARETWQKCREESRKIKKDKYIFRATVHLFDKFAESKNLNDCHGYIHTPSATVQIHKNQVTDLNIRYLNNEQALYILEYLKDYKGKTK